MSASKRNSEERARAKAPTRRLEERLTQITAGLVRLRDKPDIWQREMTSEEEREIKLIFSGIDPEFMGEGSACAMGHRGARFSLPQRALDAIEAGMSAGGWERREMFQKRLEAWEAKFQRGVRGTAGAERPCEWMLKTVRDRRAMREAELLARQTQPETESVEAPLAERLAPKRRL